MYYLQFTFIYLIPPLRGGSCSGKRLFEPSEEGPSFCKFDDFLSNNLGRILEGHLISIFAECL